MTYLTLSKFKSAGCFLAVFIPVVFGLLDLAAAAPNSAGPVQASTDSVEVAYASVFWNYCSVLGPEAVIGLLLLLAVGLWVRILPRYFFRKPDTRLTNSRCKTEVLLDTSLPRSLRRDGWWLES